MSGEKGIRGGVGGASRRGRGEGGVGVNHLSATKISQN